jgi:O-antigen ligase
MDKPLDHGQLGLFYKLAVLAYILAVVLLSYRDGLTIFAKAAGLLLVGLFFFRAISKDSKVFFPVEYKLLAAWVLIAVVSSALSTEPKVALTRLITLLQVYPISFLLTNFLLWNGDTRFFWTFMVGAAALSGGISLANPEEFVDLDGRMFGTLDNANAFAALLAISIGVTLAGLATTRSIVRKLLFLALVGFFFYLVARSGSRMGMLASFAAAVAVTLSAQAGRKGKAFSRLALVVVLGAVIVAGGIYVWNSSEFSNRYAALLTSIETGDFSAAGDLSLYGRALLYERAFELFLTSPLIGVGLDVFRTAGMEFRTIGNNSHSNYAEMLAGTGMIGAICFYAIHYSWWSRLLRAKALLQNRQMAFHVMTGFTVAVIILVHDVAWVSYYEKLTMLAIAGLIAEAHIVGDPRKR